MWKELEKENSEFFATYKKGQGEEPAESKSSSSSQEAAGSKRSGGDDD